LLFYILCTNNIGICIELKYDIIVVRNRKPESAAHLPMLRDQ